MAEQGARMNRLIDDLLSLSRIELTEHQAPSEALDLKQLLPASGGGVRTEAGGAQRPAGDADRPTICRCVAGMPTKWRRCCRICWTMRLKYGREGGLVSVEAAERSPATRWPNRPGIVISVADQGGGIPKQHLPRLTERFYRVDKGRSRAVGGTGLGLAIVKHIVNRHRGQLLIESEEGKGTTVSVWLPATPAPQRLVDADEADATTQRGCMKSSRARSGGDVGGGVGRSRPWPSLQHSPAQVGQPSPEALQSIFGEALGLLTGGFVAPPQRPSQVTHDGDTYHVSIPLPEMTTPPDAAIDVVARPLDRGAWDVTSLVLPRTGTMPMAGRRLACAFSIGQQAIHAKIEPDLARPSPFAADCTTSELRSDEDGRHAGQTIERYSLEGSVSAGTVSGEIDQRLNVQSHGSALNGGLHRTRHNGIAATG